MARVEVDVERVASALEDWDRESLLWLVLDLIEAIPKTRRAKVLERHLPLDQIRRGSRRTASVLQEVRDFHEQAVAAEFFESFMVNSKNYMQVSKGTRRFIAEFNRLGSAAATMARAGSHAEACEAFELLLDLHRRVDDVEDIIFFAAAHGAWQIEFPWRDHLPGWFASLAVTVEPEAYAQSVLSIIATVGTYKAEEMLTAARKAATPAQRRRLRGARIGRSSRGAP